MSSPKSATLIDRDELLATLEQDINVSVTGEENMEAVKRCLQEILDDIRESPVVDAVPVIRCKDCKYWMPRQICLAYDTPQNYCEKHMPDDDFYAEIWNGNDFCSRAERKEE